MYEDKKKRDEGERAIATLDRYMRILGMFVGDIKLTTQEICNQLGANIRKNKIDHDADHSGQHKESITTRSVERNLETLEAAGYLISQNKEKSRELIWRRPKHHLILGRMPDQEALAFRLLKDYIMPLIPRISHQALEPYFESAERSLTGKSLWDPLRKWSKVVRIIQAGQKLLPPEPLFPLLTENDIEQWQLNQKTIRDTILEALYKSQQCEIHYQQLWRDEPAHWIIHPLVYLQRGPAFYLLCTINDFTDVRQLALHRMLSATVLDDKARKPEGFNIDQEVERSQGMGGSGEPIRLVARFWKQAGLHLMETRLAADQIVGDEGEYHFRLIATVNDTAQLRWWLLSFGSKVEVLKPEGLRKEMANNGYWMNRMYSDSEPIV